MGKKLIALLLASVMVFAMIPHALAASEAATTAADKLNELGLFSGVGSNEDGTPNYDLDRVPTRQEAITMLVKLVGGAEEAGKGGWKTPFTDVDNWAKNWVGYAYAKGLTAGTSATTFGANDMTTAAQYLTFILKALGYDASSDFSWDKAWELSDKIGLTNGEYNADSNFTRGDVAIISYDALSTNIKGQETTLAESLGLSLGEQEGADTPATPSEGDDAEAPAVYKVNFAYNYYGMGSYKTVEVQAGGTVERPADPVRAGYIFDGWCVKEIGGTKFDFDAPINSDVTVYATWKVKPSSTPRYAVTFDSNGGSEVEAQRVVRGRTAVQPEDPTKDNFSFAGWYSNPELTTAYDFTAPVGGNITLYAKWIEAGEKVVPPEVAELFGIDPDVPDADGDGLLSYDELYVLGTDPAKADSDENGITDGNEDADCDGISNLDEIALGTEPVKADSDDDGLSDYDEINTYNTDPVNPDSDNDTLSDGDEIELGLNPLVVMSDGTTPDAERTFTQELSEENIDESLLDSAAVPSLSLTASGNINSSVFVSATGSSEFTDSRAIVGQAVDIAGVDDADGTVSFALSTGASTFATRDTTDEISAHLICKYDENGDISYLDTQYSDGVVSAAIDGEGTYYVMDVQALFDELGLELPSVSDINALTDPEPASTFSLRGSVEDERPDNSNNNGDSGAVLFSLRTEEAGESPATAVAADAGTEKITRASGGAMAQADIVFLIDTTGSMGDAIYNVKENVGYFIDELKAKGVSAALALIDFQDITVDGYDSTRIHKNGTSNWFYNMDDYKEAIYALNLGYGGDTPECAVDALETARLLDMRASAGKIFVLVTDADYKVDNRYGIPSMEAEIELLKNAGVSCSVVSSGWDQYVYEDLYTQTDGVWADIYGNFYEELMKVADKIGSDIVGDGYWIYLKGPVPVPVRLDEAPYEGSTVDTDKDGIPDVKELEGAEPTKYIDLDELVTKISHGVITGTNYGKVMMYEYASSPVESDTDFDGVQDVIDPKPRDDVFEGKLLNDIVIKDASFKLDFRTFLGSNAAYDKNLAKASLIFANATYSGNGFEYDEGKEEVTGIKKLMEKHGFVGDDILNYKLALEFDDDDISEATFGYKDVEYGGKKVRVFGVFVRGTNGTIEEWSSNFDIGNPAEWNSLEHRGFETAKQRIFNKLTEYVHAHNAENAVFWIAGHSRGAGIANLLAAKLIDDGEKVFAYTFATPATTRASNVDANEYKVIFNFVNTGDVIGYIPLPQWSFKAYGVTKSLSMETDAMHSAWVKQTGEKAYDALPSVTIKKALDKMAKECANTVAEVYELAGKQRISEEQKNSIPERALRYCKIEYRKTWFGEYDLWPSLRFALQYGAEFLGSKETVVSSNEVSYVKRGAVDASVLFELWNSRYGAALGLAALGILPSAGDIFEGGLESVTDPHSLATYYVLCEELT